jgi:hypothetical protein
MKLHMKVYLKLKLSKLLFIILSLFKIACVIFPISTLLWKLE